MGWRPGRGVGARRRRQRRRAAEPLVAPSDTAAPAKRRRLGPDFLPEDRRNADASAEGGEGNSISQREDERLQVVARVRRKRWDVQAAPTAAAPPPPPPPLVTAAAPPRSTLLEEYDPRGI